MIVFVAGMPRAGSMLTYNIVRELYDSKKHTVLPKQIPVNEASLVKEALSSAPADKTVYCIKTHLELSSPLMTQHDVKIICNIRDVRDACLSYMRFMHSDFDTSLNTVQAMMLTTEHYINNFHKNLLVVRFDEITQTPDLSVAKICQFLNLSVSDKKQNHILKKYSKKTVKQHLERISHVKIDQNGAIKGARHKEHYDVVGNFDGTYRIFDKSTSFQSNHITSNKDGEWQEVFDDEQISKLLDVTQEWLLKHNFKI